MQQDHKSLKKNQLPLCTESLKKKKKSIIIKDELLALKKQ